MNSYISINLKTLRKIFKRYKLTTRGKRGIIKASQKRSKTFSKLNTLARKMESKESIKNRIKEL